MGVLIAHAGDDKHRMRWGSSTSPGDATCRCMGEKMVRKWPPVVSLAMRSKPRLRTSEVAPHTPIWWWSDMTQRVYFWFAMYGASDMSLLHDEPETRLQRMKRSSSHQFRSATTVV